MLVRRLILLVAQAALLRAQSNTIPAVPFPANIEIDLLFPRNETYPSSAPIPVIFAIQNAAAAWAFGFDFDWNMTSLSDKNPPAEGPLSSAHVNWFPPPNGSAAIPPSDPYYIVNSTKPTDYFNTDVFPGRWALGWSFGTPKAITYACQPGAILAQGIVEFTISNETGPTATDFASSCPVAVAQIAVESYVTNCGVVPGTPAVSPSPCAASLSPAQASSVSAALAKETGSSSSSSSSSSSGAQVAPYAAWLVAAAGVPIFGAFAL